MRPCSSTISSTVVNAGGGWCHTDSARRSAFRRRPALTVTVVDAALQRLVDMGGSGSSALRKHILGTLRVREARAEQDFLMGLLLGELEGTRSAGPVSAVQRTVDRRGARAGDVAWSALATSASTSRG